MNTQSLYFFFLLNSRIVVSLLVRRYADDRSPNDLSGANLATSQRRAARS